MISIESWVSAEASVHPALRAFLHTAYTILMPPFLVQHERAHKAPTLLMFALTDVERIAQTFVWFLIIGMAIYALSLRGLGKWSLQRFAYPFPISEPGQKFSLRDGLKYVVPASFYKQASFRFDMLWLPFSVVLSFFGLLGITVGPKIVQGWLQHRFGHSVIEIPGGAFAVFLQVVIVVVARDFGRFVWHYQGHSIPFFWEFHKGHHSAEVLHPFGVRTHPVDMFIRNTYTGLGGGLAAGALIYLLGMTYTLQAATIVASILAVLATFEHFEHSHIRLPFGRYLEKVLYAPYMHHFHHGAAPRHMNKNLGISGGLLLWDQLFGTLYRPTPGEQIIWGASLEELGENNPHRTLKGFFFGPFVEAFKTLRRHQPMGLTVQPPASTRGAA